MRWGVFRVFCGFSLSLWFLGKVRPHMHLYDPGGQINLRYFDVKVLTKSLLDNARGPLSISHSQISLSLEPHADPFLNVDDENL